MADGYDIGAQQVGAQILQNRGIAAQQRLEQQNTVGAQLLNAINNASNIKPPTDPQTIADETGNMVPNPTYISKKQAYDEAQGKINDMTKQYMTLNSPEQHATFAQHLHGLIFGHPTDQHQQPALSPNSSPVAPAPPPATSATPAPPDATAPGGGVSGPFATPPANHPLNAITQGIKTLGNHLAAAANPLSRLLPIGVDPSMIAKYYQPIQGRLKQNGLRRSKLRRKHLRSESGGLESLAIST